MKQVLRCRGCTISLRRRATPQIWGVRHTSGRTGFGRHVLAPHGVVSEQGEYKGTLDHAPAFMRGGDGEIPKRIITNRDSKLLGSGGGAVNY